MCYYTDNPVADYDRYAADQDRELQKLPVCGECDHHIQDEYAYYINGEWICDNCMDANYRKAVDDFVC